jgi:hypothetical protein
MSNHDVVLAHELDAAWIIALWLAIHGGDPGPETVAAQAIAALAPYLTGAQSSFSFSQLQTQFATLDIKVTESHEEAAAEAHGKKTKARSIDEPQPQRNRQYCFQVGGKTICAQLPAIAYRQTAA